MNRMRLLIATFAVLLVLIPSHTTASTGSVPSAAAKPGITANASTTRAVQLTLQSYGYSILVDGIYGPQTTRVVRSWQRSNGLLPDGVVGPVTLASLGLTEGAVADLPAARITPPAPTGLNGLPLAPSGLGNCPEMSFYRVQAGLPDQFEAIGWRESNCRNDVTSNTGCCVGFWQNYISSHLSSQSAYRDRIINECQVSQRSDILGLSALQKQKQACVTYVVWSISGMSPWAL